MSIKVKLDDFRRTIYSVNKENIKGWGYTNGEEPIHSSCNGFIEELWV